MNSKGYIPASAEKLAQEARLWDGGALRPAGWLDATDAVPRSAASATVVLRLPKRTLAVVEAFAKREGVGCDALVSRWVDERIAEERANLDDDAAPRAKP